MLLLLTLCAGCAEGPEDCVRNAFGALCSGDVHGFKKRLTQPSAALFAGLMEFAPEAFICPAGNDLKIADAGGVREGLRIFEVTTSQGTMDIAIVQADGEWQLDLFLSEESAFYSGRKEESL